MQADEIRFLFAYDRLATRRVLAVLDGLDPAVWNRTDVVDERGLGGILVHRLGASQRWRPRAKGESAIAAAERTAIATLTPSARRPLRSPFTDRIVACSGASAAGW